MDLRIKPALDNKFPLKGFVIKGSSVKEWILELQELSFMLDEIRIFPVPGSVANAIWGCLITCNYELSSRLVGKNELCQCVNPDFYIPEKSDVGQVISKEDSERLFLGKIHVFHPDIGFVELTEISNFEELLLHPKERFRHIIKPEKAFFVPEEIRSFQVKPIAPEGVLENLEKKIFPRSEKLPYKPLNITEKGRLAFYKKLFNKSENGKNENFTESSDMFNKILNFMSSVSKKGSMFADKIRDDFDDLKERNKKQIEKLMDLLKENPEDALKYAIPLDEKGSTRGTSNGQFKMSKRWSNFSLFSERRMAESAQRGSIDVGEHYNDLYAQYNKTAQDLISNMEYEKAAFVYMKLLKNHYQAAKTLEDGELYQEAATVYLKHDGNKLKAAECYEKGSMIQEAIDIYEELKNFCKVGDLYMTLQKRDLAIEFYEKSIDVHKQRKQYYQASEVYRNKMNNEQMAQDALMKGWEENCEAFKCLKQYFFNIRDLEELKNKLDYIYDNKVNDKNREVYLKLIVSEYKRNNNLAKHLREMGYEIIAKQVSKNPKIIDELKKFNPMDKEVIKDTSRFLSKEK